MDRAKFVFILQTAPPGTGVILRFNTEKKIFKKRNFCDRKGAQRIDKTLEAKRELEDPSLGPTLSQETSNLEKIEKFEAKKELENTEDPGQDYGNGHEGLPIILIRKNMPTRPKDERVEKPKMTATKKFNQLIVKSPLAPDERKEDDVQMTEGEIMTFYLK